MTNHFTTQRGFQKQVQTPDCVASTTFIELHFQKSPAKGIMVMVMVISLSLSLLTFPNVPYIWITQ